MYTKQNMQIHSLQLISRNLIESYVMSHYVNIFPILRIFIYVEYVLSVVSLQ